MVGCAVARELAAAGLSVTVLERGEPGAGASRAAAGMLSPLAESHGTGPFLDLLRAASARFPALVAGLAAETGVDPGYRAEGTLFAALSDGDERELELRLGWQGPAGLPVERLGRDELLRLEPALSPEVRWGLSYPEDHQVDSVRLFRALLVSAQGRGARLEPGTEVAGVVVENGSARGVRLATGEVRAAGVVVVAAGCWSGRLVGLPRPLPVRPVHGQLLSLQASPSLLTRVVDSPRCYLVPRRDRVIAGTTVEETGFRAAVTPAGISAILAGAVELLPAAAGLPIQRLWSGLRPGTPDKLPVLGPDPEVKGLLYATGHFRNGVLLAPITGEVVRDLLLEGVWPDCDLAPFRADRFG